MKINIHLLKKYSETQSETEAFENSATRMTHSRIIDEDSIVVEPLAFHCSDTKTDDDNDDYREVREHWKECWKAAGYTKEDFVDDWHEKFDHFCQEARALKRHPQTLVARSTNSNTTHDNNDMILGSLQCQIWAGPIPWVVEPKTFRLGTIWGLHVKKNALVGSEATTTAISRKLVQAAKDHLGKHYCSKIVTLAHDTSDELVATGVGFQSANMLTLQLTDDVVLRFAGGVDNEGTLTVSKVSSDEEQGSRNDVLCGPVGKEHDDTVCSHWRKMWKDVDIPEKALLPDMEDVTLSFIQNARDKLHYQTFIARCRNTQKVVGSLSCQVWEGPFPQIVKASLFQLGTVWAVYVDPSFRRHGIATALMKLAMVHLRRVGCETAILIAASKAGQSVYEGLGFSPNNALVCDLSALESSKSQSEIESED
jgi:ribosomal protein S18 acetylase RimI-like enzyme